MFLVSPLTKDIPERKRVDEAGRKGPGDRDEDEEDCPIRRRGL